MRYFDHKSTAIPKVMAAVVTLMVAASAARAAGPATAPSRPKVDNPQFARWSQYKPGTSATLAGDLDAGPQGKLHIEVTQTLTSVTADAVVLSESTKMSLAGRSAPARPPAAQTVLAKVDPEAMRLTGTATVQAMGQSFPCRVYDVAGAAGGPNGTAYFNDSVPGGAVKLVLTGAGHQAITFLLTATDVK